MERFIKEYANYKKKSYQRNTLLQQEYKDEALNRIDKALKSKERGLITVDEAIRIILEGSNY